MAWLNPHGSIRTSSIELTFELTLFTYTSLRSGPADALYDLS